MIRKILLFVLLLQISSVAVARMYQWTDPDTGTTQLSGKPPSWYRSGDTGPRVFVFENGRVIDDTGISLPESENERLRQDALLKVEDDRQAALEKLVQAMRQKAMIDLQNRGEEVEEMPAEITAERQRVVESVPQETTITPTAEEMRALLDQYEQLRTENARLLLENSAPDESTPPAQQ